MPHPGCSIAALASWLCEQHAARPAMLAQLVSCTSQSGLLSLSSRRRLETAAAAPSCACSMQPLQKAVDEATGLSKAANTRKP